jgi:hypothetical protein
MITADWALSVSIGALCVSVAAFALQFRRWLDEGVKLSMAVIADALIGGATRDENTYIAITVTNRGTAATTITHMLLYNYADRLSLFLHFLRRWFKKRRPSIVLVNTVLMPLPYVLEAWTDLAGNGSPYAGTGADD